MSVTVAGAGVRQADGQQAAAAVRFGPRRSLAPQFFFERRDPLGRAVAGADVPDFGLGRPRLFQSADMPAVVRGHQHPVAGPCLSRKFEQPEDLFERRRPIRSGQRPVMIDPDDSIPGNIGRQIIGKFDDRNGSPALNRGADFIRVGRNLDTPREPIIVNLDTASPGEHVANPGHLEIVPTEEKRPAM